MKLPILVADQQIPATVPAGEASLAIAGAPYAAAERGAAQFAHAGESAALVSARIEGEKRKIAQATQAMDLFTGAAQQAEDLHLQLKTGQYVDPATGQAVAPDPAQHVARYEQGFKDIAQKTLAQTQDPQVQQATNHLLQRYYLEQSLLARRDANAMFLDTERGSVLTSMDTLAQQASTATTPQGRDFYIGLAQGYLASKKGVLSAQEIEKVGRDFQEKTTLDAVRSTIDKDPFNANIEPYLKNLHPEAQTRVLEYRLSAQRSAQAMEDHAQARLQKEIDDKRKQIVTDLDSRAMSGNLALTDLEDFRQAGWAQGEDYRRLRGMIENPGTRPSDEATKTDVMARLYKMSPTISASEINRLHQTRGPNGQALLNDADTVQFLGHLQSTVTHFTERAEDKTISGQRFAQGQAEQMLNTGLTTRSPFEALDPVSQKLKSQSLNELTARSAAFNGVAGQKGTEDPITVTRELLDRYQPILSDEQRLQTGQLVKLARSYGYAPANLTESIAAGETEAERTAAKEIIRNGAAALEAQKRSLSPGAYDAQRKTWLDLKKSIDNEWSIQDQIRQRKQQGKR